MIGKKKRPIERAETNVRYLDHKRIPFVCCRVLNPTCAHEYNDNKFSILSRGRTSFHLSTLEATYIKTSKPNLCKQKEFVYGLNIAH